MKDAGELIGRLNALDGAAQERVLEMAQAMIEYEEAIASPPVAVRYRPYSLHAGDSATEADKAAARNP